MRVCVCGGGGMGHGNPDWGGGSHGLWKSRFLKMQLHFSSINTDIANRTMTFSVI